MTNELRTLKEILKDEFDYLEAPQLLKAEAIKRVNNCCPVAGYNYPQNKFERCNVCEREIWFNNLTEEDLGEKGEKALKKFADNNNEDVTYFNKQLTTKEEGGE